MEALSALLGLVAFAVMVWAVVFAVRRIRRRRRGVIKGFLARLGMGIAVLIVAGAVAPPVPPSPPADQAQSAPSNTGSPSTTASRPPSMTPETPVPEGVPEEAQQAMVRRIVDGDTVELAALAAGTALAGTSPVEVRLLEIDTPETRDPSEPVQCYGREAAAHLTELIPVGSTVWVQRDEELKDQYDRYLLYLWNAEGTFVNLEMVRGGFAEAELYQPNDKYWDRISAAEVDARSAGENLWGVCAPRGQPESTSESEAEPEPQPEPRSKTDSGAGAYLFPPPPPDKDCSQVSANNFRVRPGDPHRFDSNGDGIGCEG
ncbi:thermonuclease family protein [Haloactinomyces albus]|nr:thermonuclease family protein [Haloactinomyces albus]